jgi:hypothetical protein
MRGWSSSFTVHTFGYKRGLQVDNVVQRGREDLKQGWREGRFGRVGNEGEKQDVGGRGDEQVRGSRIEEPCDEAPLPIPPPL